MIYISDKAKEKVLELKKHENLDEQAFVRIGIVGGRCTGLSYKLDFDNKLQTGDRVFENNGIKIVTDPTSFTYISECTLDFTDNLEPKGFYFIHSNTSCTCSCEDRFNN